MSAVPYAEYLAGETDDEGMCEAVAVCRVCSAEVICSVQWQGDDGLIVMSSGWRQGCDHPKCGDKFPAEVLRMIPSEEWRMGRAGEFQDLLFAIETARENIDPVAERFAMASLAALRKRSERP